MTDSALQQTNWEGTVPCVFELARHEITTYNTPMPLYLMLPRVCYFCSPKLVRQLNEQFLRFAPANNPRLWLEFNGKPLDWSFPIGVLRDLLRRSEDYNPWEITVRYQSFPENVLIEFETEKDAMNYYRNATKEALYLSFGSSRPASRLVERDWYELWNALYDANLEKFSEIIAPTIEVGSSRKMFPVRIVQLEGDRISVVRKPFAMDTETTQTLFDCLTHFLGDTFRKEDTTIIIQGIKVPDETPIDWLCSHLSYADQFVYIVLTLA